MIVAGREQLQGWKEIAVYLGRDERTVKRWEKQRGLPVRRIPGAGRANVYILVAELELWLAETRSLPPTANASDPDLPIGSAEAQVSSPESVPEPLDATPSSTCDVTPLATLDPTLDLTPTLEQSTNPHLPATHTAAPLDPLSSYTSRTRREPLHFSFILSLASLALILGAFGVRTVFLLRRAQERRSASLHAARASYVSPKPGADELYLQGLYLYEQRTPASLEQARLSFESAIARDPNDAVAFAGLANSYLLLREYATMPSAEAYTQAEVAARRAIALDPGLPDAHASLGFIDFFFHWDAPAATREFNEALRLDPSCTLAHHWYGSMLTHQGRYPEALDQLNLAQRLQPTSPAIIASKAFALGLGGHRTEAVAMLQALSKTELDTAAPHRILASLSLVEPRDLPAYLDQTRRFSEIRHDRETLDLFSAASAAYTRGGERAMWSEILSSERRRHPSADHPTYRLAEAEAALGLDTDAIRDFETLAHQRNDMIIGVGLDPVLRSLHRDPRFEAILSAVGYPQPPANSPGQVSPPTPRLENASVPVQPPSTQKTLAVSTSSSGR